MQKLTITQPIISCSVINQAADKPLALPDRPEVLTGKTYKVKTPLSEHALYITINNCDDRPFEIFINSKAMEHFQWIVALTRVVSAVFRHGGEVAFLVEELRSVFDPKGGYFKKGGKYMPSLVAEIGDVIKQHLTGLGLIQEDQSLAVAARAIVADKVDNRSHESADKVDNQFPADAVLCTKCSTKSAILMDGCLTCLNCGDSKCG